MAAERPEGEPELRPAEPLPEVSVVVTARNEERRLPRALEALRAQTLDPVRFEVILVDDHSRDRTVEIATAAGFVQVVRAGRHVGLAGGRNLGIAEARASLIAFTDADCIPDPDWLEQGLARLAESDCDILAGGIEVSLGTDPTVAALVDSSTYLDQELYTQRDFGAGANLWIRRDVFERFGSFDERLGPYGDEEELCQRAAAGGARLLYAPEVHVDHPARRRLREVARKSFLQGYCLAAHRRFNSGPLGEFRRLFLSPRQYLPRRRIFRLDRIRALSYEPTARERAGMYTAQYLTVALPKLAGDLCGEAAALFGRFR